MKVWQCDDSRPVPGLVPAEVKTPGPQRGEVLIRVHAVGDHSPAEQTVIPASP